MVTQSADKREQGVIIGLTQSLTSVAQITAPLISGVLIGRHYLTVWAVWSGLLAGLALFFEPRTTAAPPKERDALAAASRL
jgi:MFS family permease